MLVRADAQRPGPPRGCVCDDARICLVSPGGLDSVSGGLQASQFPGQLVVPFHERFEFQCGESPFAYHHPPIDHGPGGLRAGTQQQGAHGIVHRTTGKAQGAKIEQRQIGAHPRRQVADVGSAQHLRAAQCDFWDSLLP